MSAQFRAFVNSIILKAHVASGNAPHTAIAAMQDNGIPTAITIEDINFMQDVKRKFLAGTLTKYEKMSVQNIPGWDFHSTDVDDGEVDLADVNTSLDHILNYKKAHGTVPLPPPM